jgi:hypothetical protein
MKNLFLILLQEEMDKIVENTVGDWKYSEPKE